MADGVSLNPETFLEGGGLIGDVDVLFKSNTFAMFDYGGTVPGGSPSLKAVMLAEGEEEEMDQYYSLGNARDWQPSDDGTQLVAIGNATGIRATSNGGMFLKALVDAGFPADKLGDDITVLDGLQAHVIRVPVPERAGIAKSKKQKDREEKYGPPTLLIVSEIITLPWEKAKAKGAPKKAAAKGKAKAKAKGKKTGEESGGADEKAVETVMAILAEDGTVAKKDLPAKIFQAMKTDPDRNEVIKLVFDDAFLSNGPWGYEDGTLIAG